jgi:hypothetical protein
MTYRLNISLEKTSVTLVHNIDDYVTHHKHHVVWTYVVFQYMMVLTASIEIANTPLQASMKYLHEVAIIASTVQALINHNCHY